ncbi:hypothetical protein SDC9_132917 [bioreactor metagenome]|uniref:Uncharacterized protein n=1 Tax=bioreactor metagenome TaxID=1076179 RepID=A0A645D9F0_9ZZZZ
MAQVIQIHTVPVALISQSGIGIAITDDHYAAGQGGFEHFFHDLGTGGTEEQDLSARVHAGIAQFHNDLADLIADGGTTRFTGGQHLITTLADELRQYGYLHRFTAAIRTFKSNEHRIPLFAEDTYSAVGLTPIRLGNQLRFFGHFMLNAAYSGIGRG